MQPTRRTTAWMLPFLAGGLLLLGACGGGGGGGSEGSQDPVTINIPPPTGSPPAQPPPSDPPPSNPPPSDPPPSDPPPTDPPPADPPPADPPPTNPPPTNPTVQRLPTFPSFAGFDEVHGVALDPDSGAVYAVRAGGGDLLRLVPGARAPEAVGPVPLPHVRALTYDPESDMLYAVSDDGPGGDDALHAINPASGEPSLLGTITGYRRVEGLAFHGRDAARRLYAVDTEHDVLLTLEVATGLPTSVGPLGAAAGDLHALCSHDDQALLGVDAGRGDVFAIDTDTGRCVLRITLPEGPLRGFAYAPDEQAFYAALPDNELHRLDIEGTWIGWDQVKGLAYDADAHRLYGVHTGYGLILRADPESGWRAPIVQIQDGGLEGLAYDAAEPMLYALSRTTGALYRIRPVDGDVQPGGTVSRLQGPWTGLAGLAFAAGKLYTIDTATADLLEITPPTRTVAVLASFAGQTGLQGLAYDADEDRLLTHAGGSRTVFAVARARGAAPAPLEQTPHAAIGGLAWIADERRLVGSDLARRALATVYQVVPRGLGYDQVHGLTRQATLLGFDNDTQRVLAIDDEAGGGVTELATHAGLRLEGLAYDGLADVTYAVNAADDSLMVIASDGSMAHRGAVGALGGREIRALAFDPTTPPGVLYGFDNAQRKLVQIDLTTAAPTEIGAAIARGSIEAMTWLPGTPATLVAVDRATRMLMEIDPTTGAAADVVALGFDDVRGMARGLLPDELVIVDATLDRIAAIDRFDGSVVETFDGGTTRGGGDTAALLLWPRGAVRPPSVEGFGISVDATYAGDAYVVLRRGTQVLHRARFRPDTLVSFVPLPAEARHAVARGGRFTWGLEFGPGKPPLEATFTCVRASAGARDLAALEANAVLRKQKPHVIATRRARVLRRHGLASEAALLAAGARALAPESRSAARELKQALHALVGREAAAFERPHVVLAGLLHEAAVKAAKSGSKRK